MAFDTIDLPPARQGREAAPDLAAIRKAIAGACDAGQFATTPPMEAMSFGDRRALVARAPHAERAKVIHLHGGGYRMGAPATVGAFATALAKTCDVEVICPAYGLAPEHPFPSALRDVASVIEAVRALPGPLFLSGDSAGGGLAASLAAHMELDFAGLILLSPWLDLSVQAASYESNAQSDPLFSRDAANIAAELYLEGHPVSDPLASPIEADLKSCPPTYVNVGSGEVLLDDAREFHARLQKAGVESALSIIEGMDHVAVTRGTDLVGSDQAMAEIVAFIDRRLHSANNR